jgi:methyltransferase (TIGR00027 family)
MSDLLGSTARWTAAVRAQESTREDRFFNDPWAAALAGQEGADWLEKRGKDGAITIVLRTRFFDDFLQRVTLQNGIRQVVLMAAGMDTRAFRLGWPEQTYVFELDQSSVLDHKENVLRSAGARPACMRRTIEADLTGEWQDGLKKAGFEPQTPSVWLLEGFLFYLPSQTGAGLLERVIRFAVPGSWLGFDVMNGITLSSPLTRQWVQMQADSGAPWIGTMDDPEEFLKKRGCRASITQAGQADANHGRWPYPVMSTMMPEMPHNWFVTAQKERSGTG